MGLISIIVFTVSQSVEERTTLLGGGGDVALLYTLDILCTWQCSTQSYSKEHQTMHAGANNSILSTRYSAPWLGRFGIESSIHAVNLLPHG